MTVAIIVGVVFYWEELRKLGGYGYLGAFIISVFGGATIIAPIPMTPVVFALGTVMKPAFARKRGKLEAAYARVMSWMERRGSLILFLLSAVLNPFFYPAALSAGALRFSIRRFFLICWCGKTVKGITVAAAGYWGLGSLLRALGVPI